MPRKWYPQAGDYCRKGDERGIVRERVSQRTGRKYLSVQILNGPRRWQFEFPEKGWISDEGEDCAQRPSHDLEGFAESFYNKTKHHSR